MLRCHTSVTEEGMLAERRRLETLSLPEMKRVMRSYKAGKAQKKALKKERERETRAARAHERAAGDGGNGWRRKRSGHPPLAVRFPPSGANSACAVGARATWLRTARITARTSLAASVGCRGMSGRSASPATKSHKPMYLTKLQKVAYSQKFWTRYLSTPSIHKEYYLSNINQILTKT